MMSNCLAASVSQDGGGGGGKRGERGGREGGEGREGRERREGGRRGKEIIWRSHLNLLAAADSDYACNCF